MNNKKYKLTPETLELLAKRYEGLPQEEKEITKRTLEKLRKNYANFGLSRDEITLAYFNALDYFTEATREKRNIQDDWIRVIFEREILLHALAKRIGKDLVENGQRMELEDFSLN